MSKVSVVTPIVAVDRDSTISSHRLFLLQSLHSLASALQQSFADMSRISIAFSLCTRSDANGIFYPLSTK